MNDNGTKSFYLSKIVWLNVLTTVVAVLTLLQDNPLIPPEAQPYVLAAVGIVNVVLRVWFTDMAIG